MNELVLTQLCRACSFIRGSLCGPGFSFDVHPILFWLLEQKCAPRPRSGEE